MRSHTHTHIPREYITVTIAHNSYLIIIQMPYQYNYTVVPELYQICL